MPMQTQWPKHSGIMGQSDLSSGLIQSPRGRRNIGRSDATEASRGDIRGVKRSMATLSHFLYRGRYRVAI
jgi:hypothetical protein